MRKEGIYNITPKHKSGSGLAKFRGPEATPGSKYGDSEN